MSEQKDLTEDFQQQLNQVGERHTVIKLRHLKSSVRGAKETELKRGSKPKECIDIVKTNNIYKNHRRR